MSLLCSMTTFLDSDVQNRSERFMRVKRAIDSIVFFHGERCKTEWTWLVVNEAIPQEQNRIQARHAQRMRNPEHFDAAHDGALLFGDVERCRDAHISKLYFEYCETMRTQTSNAAWAQWPWKDVFAALFPWIRFVQKTPMPDSHIDERKPTPGQGGSLNYILRELRKPQNLYSTHLKRYTGSSDVWDLPGELHEAPPFQWWCHWEESWEAVAEGVFSALRILNAEPHISRVQLSRSAGGCEYAAEGSPCADWTDISRFYGKTPVTLRPAGNKRWEDSVPRTYPFPLGLSHADEKREVFQSEADVEHALQEAVEDKVLQDKHAFEGSAVEYTLIEPPHKSLDLALAPLRYIMVVWPVFSLRPSVMRASAFSEEAVGFFSESPKDWPWSFEHLFGTRWESSGGRAAVLGRGTAARIAGHQSVGTASVLRRAEKHVYVIFQIAVCFIVVYLVLRTIRRRALNRSF